MCPVLAASQCRAKAREHFIMLSSQAASPAVRSKPVHYHPDPGSFAPLPLSYKDDSIGA
jgi:hypothetical protein